MDAEKTRLEGLITELEANFTTAEANVQAMRAECDKFKGTESEGYKQAY